MANRNDVGLERYATIWPFSVGSWVLPAFWLVVVFVASLGWWFH